MPSNSFYEAYLKMEKEAGVLSSLKKRNKITNKKLSILTGISENTLNNYKDNEKLFNKD